MILPFSVMLMFKIAGRNIQQVLQGFTIGDSGSRSRKRHYGCRSSCRYCWSPRSFLAWIPIFGSHQRCHTCSLLILLS